MYTKLITRVLPATFFTLLLALPAMTQEAAPVATAADAGPAILPLLMRWTHILCAIVMLGGTFFVRFILIPAAKRALPKETVLELRASVIGGWRKVVPWLILGFLGSGFYNYLAVTRHAHPDEPRYHMLFGIKFLLSLVVFALASILISKRERPSRIREKHETWLVVLLGLGVSVVLIAGYMKLM